MESQIYTNKQNKKLNDLDRNYNPNMAKIKYFRAYVTHLQE